MLPVVEMEKCRAKLGKPTGGRGRSAGRKSIERRGGDRAEGKTTGRMRGVGDLQWSRLGWVDLRDIRGNVRWFSLV